MATGLVFSSSSLLSSLLLSSSIGSAAGLAATFFLESLESSESESESESELDSTYRIEKFKTVRILQIFIAIYSKFLCFSLSVGLA